MIPIMYKHMTTCDTFLLQRPILRKHDRGQRVCIHACFACDTMFATHFILVSLVNWTVLLVYLLDSYSILHWDLFWNTLGPILI